ncbi:MAG: hypothetical protein QHH74_12365 [Spirochaetota bacterium]|nr:hypothetical protein [Spirochaetota bacterium]
MHIRNAKQQNSSADLIRLGRSQNDRVSVAPGLAMTDYLSFLPPITSGGRFPM